MGVERERVAGFGRLEDGLRQAGEWYRWGPYLSERQWGTVREDYSANGDAWNYLPHDHARSTSNASFADSTIYGLSILMLLGRYFVHRVCRFELRQFQSFAARYRRVQ